MSNAALSWAFPQPILGAKKAVLVALAEHADSEGHCWPSIDRLALYAGLSVRAVRREIGTLVRLGLIDARRSGGRVTSHYYLQLSDAVSPPEPPPNVETHPAEPFHYTNGHAVTPDLLAASTPFNPASESGLTENNPASESGLTRPVSPGFESQPGLRVPPTRTQSPPNPYRTLSKEESGLHPDSAGSAVAVATPPTPPDIRKSLWSDGRTILRGLTGQLHSEAGKQLGAFLKRAGGDATVVMASLEAAQREQPYEVVPWVFAAISARCQPAQRSIYETMRAEIGYSVLFPVPGQDDPPLGELSLLTGRLAS